MMKLYLSGSLVLAALLVTTILSAQTTETVVQTGHYAEVTAVCFSSDGKFIATGSADKTVKLWRRSDGKEIRTFQGNSAAVERMEISRNSSLLLGVTSKGTLTVWDIPTGKIILQKKPKDDVFTCAAFSNDATKIIAGTYKSFITEYSLPGGEKLRDIKAVPRDIYSEKGFEYESSKTVAYSTDGKFIIAGVADYTAIVWDASTGKELKKYKNSNSTCSSCYIEAVLTPDNKYVISGCSDSLKVFDRLSGAFVTQLYGQGGTAEYLSVSADNRFLSAVEYGVAEVWDLKNWKKILKTGDYSEKKVMAAALSPDGRELAAANEKRTTDILLTEKGTVLLTLKGYLNQVDERLLNDSYMYWAALVNEARLSPDGKYIAVGRTGNNAKLIDFKTGKVFRTLRGHRSMVISLAFSGDGKLLATGGIDGKAIVWNVETGDSVRTISFADRKNAVFSVDISSDNKYLVTADWGGMVILWDIATGESVRAITPHGRTGVYQVKLLPNNVYFISAGLDGKLKMTEVDTGEEIRTFIGHTGIINSISFNPAGDKFITSSRDGSVRVWDIASGLQIRKLPGHVAGSFAARFDPAGKFIVTGGDDFLVKLWEAETGKLVSEFAGHTGGVGDVNITPDLNFIISGSRDGSIRIWNTKLAKEIVSVVFMNENDWFIKSPEGYFDASEGAYSSISFVRGTELYNIGQFFNEFYRPGLYQELFSAEKPAMRQNLSQAIDKYPPPSVEVVYPEPDVTTDNPMMTMMVKVTNNGGGVREFKVMQNGKRQDVDYSDLKRMTKAGQYAMKTFDINLVPGVNDITISAFSEGEIESAAATVSTTYKGMAKTSDLWLVCVGINKYTNESLNLTYARPDAKAFSELVASKGDKLFNKIHTFTIYDSDATRQKIMATLDEISRSMKKEDVFVWFYAGHGSMVANEFYFITSEVTALYQQDKLKNALYVKDLQDKFRQLPALKQVVFIDACQSGSSVEALAMRGGAEEKALAQLSRSSGIHVMASSESQQQSAEIKSLNHGVFTYVLLEALSGKADGAPADSKVTVYEIKSYVDDQVPELSYKLIRHKQFPSTFSIGHDFPLVME